MTPEQLERYKRHLLIKEIGGPGQQRLAAAHAVLIGAGALGGPCAMYLAAAGVGHLTIYDDDIVDISNLQRQVQFTTHNVGKNKVDVLADRLARQNPDCEVTSVAERWTGRLPEPNTTLLIDASDNFETRFAINEAALACGVPLLSGAVRKWDGQLGWFAPRSQHSSSDRSGSCYRCFVPETPPDADTCDTDGVVGPVTGIVSTRMALEAMKLMVSPGTVKFGTVWIFDGLTGASRTVSIAQDPACKSCAAA